MRAREFIGENGRRKKFRKGFIQASPNLVTYDTLDNNNNPYLALRFGIALAGSPDEDMDREGPVGGRFMMINYSDADAEIRRGAEKIMGIKSQNSTNTGSKEMKIVNTVSPVSNWNKSKKKKEKKK